MSTKYTNNYNETTIFYLFYFIYIYEDLEKAKTIHLQEHSSDYLRCYIKGKAKQATELVNFSLV